MPSRTAAFVKFFTEEEHADQFLRGSLFMRKLGYFQRLEAAETGDGRPDAHEGVVSWHQPDRTELTINFEGFDPIKITKADLAGPVAITRTVYSDLYVFCMSTMRILDPAELSEEHEEIEEQMRVGLRLDQRCLHFGPHAVVVDANKFITQLCRALEGTSHWYKADRVEYYEAETFHGDFETEVAPFRKQMPFAYQNEYRVCLLTAEAGNEPMIFEIGDISGFAIKTRSEDVNGSFKLTLNRPAT